MVDNAMSFVAGMELVVLSHRTKLYFVFVTPLTHPTSLLSALLSVAFHQSSGLHHSRHSCLSESFPLEATLTGRHRLITHTVQRDTTVSLAVPGGGVEFVVHHASVRSGTDDQCTQWVAHKDVVPFHHVRCERRERCHCAD